jgi:hypothetical protein
VRAALTSSNKTARSKAQQPKGASRLYIEGGTHLKPLDLRQGLTPPPGGREAKLAQEARKESKLAAKVIPNPKSNDSTKETKE